jgi:hypothetical protein
MGLARWFVPLHARLIVLWVGGLTACGSGGGFPPDAGIDAPPPPGMFKLDWSLVDGNNSPITCASVGAVTVTLPLRNRVTFTGSTEVFGCNQLTGTSGSLTPGMYDIDFELHSTSAQLATAPRQTPVVINSGQTTTLMAVTFVVP